MPLISYDASIGINNENKNKQQKQAQPHDTWNARHARNTRSTYSASESTGSVRDTIPRQQDKHEWQQQQQHHIILVGFLKQKRMLVVRSLALAKTREVESFFLDGLLNVKDAHQMDSILDLELDVKLRQTLNDVTIKNQFLILIIDSSY